MTIERMQSGDIPAVLALEKQRLKGRSLGPEELARAVINDGYVGLVAKEAGVKGYILAVKEGREAEILSIAVVRENEGQGLGTALLTALEKALKDEGTERLLLEVKEDNERARRLYETQGYKIYRIRKGYYQGQDALCLAKRLK